MPDMDKRRELFEMFLRDFPKGAISDREMEQLRAGIDDDIYQEPITSEFHYYPERTAQDIAREEIAERDRLRLRERMEFESRFRKRMGGLY